MTHCTKIARFGINASPTRAAAPHRMFFGPRLPGNVRGPRRTAIPS